MMCYYKFYCDDNSQCDSSCSLTDGSHHHKVATYLRPLMREIVDQVGGALGLVYPNLRKMQRCPDDMVNAWLRKEDYVLTSSGDPTWRSLAKALSKEGQTGIAQRIEEEKSKTT